MSTILSPALPLSEVDAPICAKPAPAAPAEALGAPHEAAGDLGVAMTSLCLAGIQLSRATARGSWRPETRETAHALLAEVDRLHEAVEAFAHLARQRGGMPL